MIRSLIVFIFLCAATANAELLFHDDFSTGDVSNHNNYFRWGREGDIKTSGHDSQIFDTIAGPYGTNVKAMKFVYSPSTEWQEYRFHLTTSTSEVRTEAGASNTVYGTVWMSFWYRHPSNYTHGSTNPSNNKMWVTLWKNNYGSGGGDGVGFAVDAWRYGTGQSRIGAWSNINGTNYGNWYEMYEPRIGTFWADSDHFIGTQYGVEHYAYMVLDSEKGEWVHVAIGMKASDSSTANNGFLKVFKNGQKVISWEGMNNYHNTASLRGSDRGYLMGWHNGGYSATTTYYITDFRFGTTEASVMLDEEEDTTAPTVTAFTIPSTSSSLTVSVSTFTATDAVGVTGYCVNESATAPTAESCSGSGWSASAQSSYVFSTEGSKTLYAWAKDAAGNISTSLNDGVTITLPPGAVSIGTPSGAMIINSN